MVWLIIFFKFWDKVIWTLTYLVVLQSFVLRFPDLSKYLIFFNGKNQAPLSGSSLYCLQIEILSMPWADFKLWHSVCMVRFNWVKLQRSQFKSFITLCRPATLIWHIIWMNKKSEYLEKNLNLTMKIALLYIEISTKFKAKKKFEFLISLSEFH